MRRRIISIDKEKCNGCGLCIESCRDRAIEIIDGKAELTREDYCDGLGVCLAVCSAGAISYVEKEAALYNYAAVRNARAMREESRQTTGQSYVKAEQTSARAPAPVAANATMPPSVGGALNWPIKLKMVPVSAPHYAGADLVVASDCVGALYPDFYRELVAGRVVLLGCGRVDMMDYTQKITDILQQNDVKSVTYAGMDTSCCSRMGTAVRLAVQGCGKRVPLSVKTVSADGSMQEGG